MVSSRVGSIGARENWGYETILAKNKYYTHLKFATSPLLKIKKELK